MKERPILFSAPMVHAILEGRKTQTRRVVKDRELRAAGMPHHAQFADFSSGRWCYADIESGLVDMPAPKCPYGAPGDRLWLREAWRASSAHDDLPPRDIPPTKNRLGIAYLASGEGYVTGRYRHARFMPRWASRITLEVTGVRVERLQEIGEADAQAEGAPYRVNGVGNPPPHSYRTGFVGVWVDINGADSWAANPWVWVIEFQKVQQ